MTDETPKAGHNRVRIEGIDSDALNDIVKRWENLQDEIDDAKEGQKSIMAEAKARGLDTKYVRKVLSIRRKPLAQYKAELEATENYLLALGLL